VDDYFSIQSTSKVVTFATALAEVGEKETLSYVGGFQLEPTPADGGRIAATKVTGCVKPSVRP
jgi:hypothetical protein